MSLESVKLVRGPDVRRGRRVRTPLHGVIGHVVRRLQVPIVMMIGRQRALMMMQRMVRAQVVRGGRGVVILVWIGAHLLLLLLWLCLLTHL